MSNKIADSLFSSGPLEELLAVDVYKTVDSNTKTGFISQIKKFGNEAADIIKGTPDVIKDFANVLRIENGKVNIDKASLTDRLIDIASSAKGPFKDLSAGVQDKVFGAFGFSSETSGDIRSLIGDSISILNTSDIKDARGITDILNSLTGNSKLAKLFDLEAEMALYGGILGEAIRLGIPDAIDIIATKFSDDRTMHAVLSDNLRLSATSGDLRSVSRIVAKIGPDSAIAQVPDLIDIILMGYSFQMSDGVVDYTAKSAELIALLVLINPQWDKYKRNGVYIVNLSPFAYASGDAIKLFLLNPAYKVQAMMAPEYSSEHLLNIAGRFYPMAVL